jgi:hypothetical protein
MRTSKTSQYRLVRKLAAETVFLVDAAAVVEVADALEELVADDEVHPPATAIAASTPIVHIKRP